MKIAAYKRSSFLFLFATVFVGAATSAVAVVEARSQYYGVCSSLNGFPGALQRVGWLSSGTCEQPDAKKSKNSKNSDNKDVKPDGIGGGPGKCGGSCTVDGKTGTCTNTGKPGGSAVCTCVANISRS